MNAADIQSFLHNVAGIETLADGSLRLCRLPLALLPHISLKGNERSFCPGGVELRFRMRSDTVKITLRRLPDTNDQFNGTGAVLAGVYYGDFQYRWHALQAGDTEIVITPPPVPYAEMEPHRRDFDPHVVRLIFPSFPAVQLVRVEGELQPVAAADRPVRTFLAYGSSIIHGAYAPLATETLPAIIGRALHADVLNVGIAGAARLEPPVADWIVSRDDWHAASVELGINLVFEPEPERFRLRVRRFLAPFASDPHGRPLACLDMLPFQQELNGEQACLAAEFRRAVSEEVAILHDPRIRHISYAPLLENLTLLCADLLHPAAHGFHSLGGRLLEALIEFPPFMAALRPQ